MLRKVWTAIVLVLLVSLSRGENAEAQRKLKVGYLTVSASYSPLFVSQEVGIFAKNGLDVELIFVHPAVHTQALLAGDLDIGVAGPLEIEANLRGADFVLLATLAATPALPFLITRKEITKVEQLKGKKLGISRLGAAPHRILEMTLEKLGLNPAEVSIVQAGGTGERLLAVRAGSIDGSIVSVEAAYAAKKFGLNLLVNLRALGIDYLLTTVLTTRRFVDKNEDTVRRFIKAIVEGIHYYKSRKRESIEIMGRYLKDLDREVLEFAYDFSAEDAPRKPHVSVSGLKAVLDNIATRNPKATQVRPEQFIDSRFVKELDQSGYIESLYK